MLDNIDKLEGVERLVVAHVSERHGGHRNILRLLAAALPPTVANKVKGLSGTCSRFPFVGAESSRESQPRRLLRLVALEADPRGVFANVAGV